MEMFLSADGKKALSTFTNAFIEQLIEWTAPLVRNDGLWLWENAGVSVTAMPYLRDPNVYLINAVKNPWGMVIQLHRHPHRGTITSIRCMVTQKAVWGEKHLSQIIPLHTDEVFNGGYLGEKAILNFPVRFTANHLQNVWRLTSSSILNIGEHAFTELAYFGKPEAQKITIPWQTHTFSLTKPNGPRKVPFWKRSLQILEVDGRPVEHLPHPHSYRELKHSATTRTLPCGLHENSTLKVRWA